MAYSVHGSSDVMKPVLMIASAALALTLVGCKPDKPCADVEVPAAWTRLGTKMVPPGAHVCKATDTQITMEIEGDPKERIDLSDHFEKQGWVRKEQRISDLGVSSILLKKFDDGLMLTIRANDSKRGITEAIVGTRNLSPGP